MNAVRSDLRMAMMLFVGVTMLTVAVMPSAGQGIDKGKGVIPAAASAEQLSFDQPLTWMYDAKLNYTAVKDYSCMLASQERVNGKLHDEAYIKLKVLAQPFCVHMVWLAPLKDKEQEVAFIQGKNDNKMRVKSPHLAKVIGFLSIPVNDPRVLQNSRHTILEAGIGNMIEQTIKSWEIERSLGKTKVLPPLPATYNGRECIKVEVVRLEKNAQLYCYRTVIYLEKASKMPVRLENYDWPKAGAPDGELLEKFSYVNIEWNKGLKEADFVK